MKLSEAIRLGAMLKPQGFDRYGSTETCAWGAAFDAIGVLASSSSSRVHENWPWAIHQRTRCPQCLKHERSVEGVIICLNDNHQWSREQIADWVATVEPKEVLLPAVEQAGAVVANEQTPEVR